MNTVPIEEGHDGIYSTQWPMGDIEACGLVKMDFLGLRNLTILEQIRWSINCISTGRLYNGTGRFASPSSE